MAENPQRPQERIDELIRRIEKSDSEAYTERSVQHTIQTGFNRRNTDLFDMLIRMHENALTEAD